MWEGHCPGQPPREPDLRFPRAEPPDKNLGVPEKLHGSESASPSSGETTGSRGSPHIRLPCKTRVDPRAIREIARITGNIRAIRGIPRPRRATDGRRHLVGGSTIQCAGAAFPRDLLDHPASRIPSRRLPLHHPQDLHRQRQLPRRDEIREIFRLRQSSRRNGRLPAFDGLAHDRRR